MIFCCVRLTAYQLSVLRLALLIASDEMRKDFRNPSLSPDSREDLRLSLKAMKSLSEKFRKSENDLENES